MNMGADIAGREFDWFAMDNAGYVAMFATAGFGIVPDLVLADYLAHERLSEFFPIEHWGSEKVWDVYARFGLYVYDWKNGGHQGHYCRVRVPTSVMAEDLSNCFRDRSSLSRFDFQFDTRVTIDLVK
jgi:hypothetical protein